MMQPQADAARAARVSRFEWTLLLLLQPLLRDQDSEDAR